MKFNSRYVDLNWSGKILEAAYKQGPSIDIEAAKIIVEERLAFTNGKDVPALIIDSGLVKMDKQARDFLSSNEGIKGLRSVALISNSKVNSMLVNFILKISRPNLPVKVFTERALAINWLESFLDENPSI